MRNDIRDFRILIAVVMLILPVTARLYHEHSPIRPRGAKGGIYGSQVAGLAGFGAHPRPKKCIKSCLQHKVLQCEPIQLPFWIKIVGDGVKHALFNSVKIPSKPKPR